LTGLSSNTISLLKVSTHLARKFFYYLIKELYVLMLGLQISQEADVNGLMCSAKGQLIMPEISMLQTVTYAKFYNLIVSEL